MSFFVFVLLGVLGGVPAGMGMGGGTVTIPLLLAVGVAQKSAQCANLFAFLPMGIVALKMHAQNGLLRIKKALPMAMVAMVFALFGAYVASVFSSDLLKRAFGVFLMGLGVFTGLALWKRKKKK